MNGTDNRKDTVWFSLYRVPVVAKEDYHLKGALAGASINGTYQELTQTGEIIESGRWVVKRVP